MSWIAEHWIAVVLIIGYVAFLAANGLRGSSQTASVADYYVGGRRMSGWVVGISFCATFASTNSYVGHAGKGYAIGVPWLLFPLFMAAFVWLSWTTVAPRLRRFTAMLDALTLPDYLARRYASPVVGRLAAVLVLFSSVLYLVAIFKGAGNVLQLFLAIDYEWAVFVSLVVVVFYTCLGGFISVARTDVVQGAAMLCGSALVGYFVITSAAQRVDLATLATDVRTTQLFHWDAGLPFAVLVGILLSGSLKLMVDPRQVSRFFALRDQASVRKGMLVALVGLSLIQLGIFPVGILAHLFFDSVADTDMIMPMLLLREDVFPGWAADVLLVAILSAAMSSMDSVLLVAGSVVTRDLLRSKDSVGIQTTRIMILVLAVIAALLALNPPGDIVEITIFSGSLYAACFLPVLLFSLHWRRGHGVAAVGSMAVGVAVLLLWRAYGFSVQLHEVFPALACSTLTFIGLALWVRMPTPEAAALLSSDDAAALSS